MIKTGQLTEVPEYFLFKCAEAHIADSFKDQYNDNNDGSAMVEEFDGYYYVTE